MNSLGISTPLGKKEIREFINNIFTSSAEILDVGAGYGIYKDLLGPSFNNIDAVDTWEPAIKNLAKKYRYAYHQNIKDFDWTKRRYNLVIFGDVIEHMTVEDAQYVIGCAEKYADHILIGVPYLYEQDELYGNPNEKHLQPDLTPEIFNERYPGFKLICYVERFYGYYFK